MSASDVSTGRKRATCQFSRGSVPPAATFRARIVRATTGARASSASAAAPRSLAKTPRARRVGRRGSRISHRPETTFGTRRFFSREARLPLAAPRVPADPSRFGRDGLGERHRWRARGRAARGGLEHAPATAHGVLRQVHPAKSQTKLLSRVKCNVYYYRANYFCVLVLSFVVAFWRNPYALLACALACFSLLITNDSFAQTFSERTAADSRASTTRRAAAWESGAGAGRPARPYARVKAVKSAIVKRQNVVASPRCSVCIRLANARLATVAWARRSSSRRSLLDGTSSALAQTSRRGCLPTARSSGRCGAGTPTREDEARVA